MHPKFSYNTFAVINEGCPLDQTVLGSNVARLVVGTIPDAIELELDYESIRTLIKISTAALTEMTALSAHDT